MQYDKKGFKQYFYFYKLSATKKAPIGAFSFCAQEVKLTS